MASIFVQIDGLEEVDREKIVAELGADPEGAELVLSALRTHLRQRLLNDPESSLRPWWRSQLSYWNWVQDSGIVRGEGRS